MKNYMDITEKIKWTYTIHGGVYIAAACFAVLEIVLHMDTVFLLLQGICFTAVAVISGKSLKEEKCINDEMSEYNLRRAKATTFDLAKVFVRDLSGAASGKQSGGGQQKQFKKDDLAHNLKTPYSGIFSVCS